jgi:hypothetical protein
MAVAEARVAVIAVGWLAPAIFAKIEICRVADPSWFQAISVQPPSVSATVGWEAVPPTATSAISKRPGGGVVG